MKEQAIVEIKQSIIKAFECLGLVQFVSLKEIEKELIEVETMFQSRLILGIMRRIMHRQNDVAAELFIPAITEWKNYLPHKDLGGLTPFEHRKKYPPGRYEAQFITNLMNEYQAMLSSKNIGEPLNIKNDFEEFQKQYFERVPFEHPFFNDKGKLMTIWEIIIEERRRNNHPKDSLELIGVKLFVENTAEGLGWRMAEFDNAYAQVLDELVAMKSNARLRKRKRISEIRKFFERDEPYHRCGPEPHIFYLNYAMVVFLEEDEKQALAFLDIAFKYQPDYALARKMKEQITSGRKLYTEE